MDFRNFNLEFWILSFSKFWTKTHNFNLQNHLPLDFLYPMQVTILLSCNSTLNQQTIALKSITSNIFRDLDDLSDLIEYGSKLPPTGRSYTPKPAHSQSFDRDAYRSRNSRSVNAIPTKRYFLWHFLNRTESIPFSIKTKPAPNGQCPKSLDKKCADGDFPFERACQI